jgi:hypothetical protein
MDQIPPKHKQVDKDGYQFTFYPGFLREGSVEVVGEAPVVLYRQEKPYDIRDSPDEPLQRFELRLVGGKNGRNVTFHVDDPQHSIAEITVRLYPRGHRPGEDAEGPDDPDEIVVIRNDAVLCPPVC